MDISAIITYEQQRLEYFKHRKAECERKLEWYQNRKTISTLDETVRLEKCDEYSKKISYYADAVKAFGG